MAKVASHYADLYQWTAPSDIPGIQNARQFFRAIGIDPTKRRPSSEALLQRAIKKKDLYTINTLVDVGNWCSLEFLLPTCVYDADNIRGDVTLRLGAPGETYLALNNRDMEFEGRFVLADDNGPFGSPMTDAARTAVSTDTTNALLGIWAPLSFDSDTLRHHAETFAQRAIDYCGGTVFSIEYLSARPSPQR